MSAATPARFAEAFGDWTPSAVVFDCDGLLLDTESVWQRAEDSVVAEHGAVLQEGDQHVLHGSTIEVAAELIARRSGHSEAEVLASLHREFDSELATGIRTMPGAAEILQLAGEKVPLGCASNSERGMLDAKLAALGITDLVDASIAIEDVAEPKPAPDMYLAAARALDADPAHCLGFEDSETGAEAALAAGLQLIAVPSIPGQEPRAPRRLTSMADPVLTGWIAQWEARR